MTADELAIFDLAGKLYATYVAQYYRPTSQDKAVLLYKVGEEAMTLYKHIQSLDIHDTKPIPTKKRPDGGRIFMRQAEFLRLVDRHKGDQETVAQELGLTRGAVWKRMASIDPSFKWAKPKAVKVIKMPIEVRVKEEVSQ